MSGKATLLESLFSFRQGYLRNLAFPKETIETLVPNLNLEPQTQSKHRLATEEPSCLPPCIRAKSSTTNSLPLLFAPIPDTIKMPKMEKTAPQNDSNEAESGAHKPETPEQTQENQSSCLDDHSAGRSGILSSFPWVVLDSS